MNTDKWVEMWTAKFEGPDAANSHDPQLSNCDMCGTSGCVGPICDQCEGFLWSTEVMYDITQGGDTNRPIDITADDFCDDQHCND